MVNKIEYIPWTRKTFPDGCWIKRKDSGLIEILKCQDYEPCCVVWKKDYSGHEIADFKNLFNNYDHVVGIGAKGEITLNICGDKIQYME